MYEHKNEDIVHPLIFISSNVEAYQNSGLYSSQLMELANLGLVQCDFKSEYIFLKKKVLRWGNRVIVIYGDPDNDDKIKAGNVKLTCDGTALFRIVGEHYKQYRADILDFTVTKFLRRNCKVVINGKPVI